uniref:Endothelin-converting enzyme 1 n=1 Tax=Biomphalaria glabrata TaxID=6526 RepID=A0A2C9LW01_BIOGL
WSHHEFSSPDKPASWFNSSAELKAKQYYISCMDENKLIDKAGGQPLLDLIHRLNWGVNISEWNVDWQLPQHWDMTPHLGDMHLLNIGAFMNLYVAEDDKDSSVNILQVSLKTASQNTWVPWNTVWDTMTLAIELDKSLMSKNQEPMILSQLAAHCATLWKNLNAAGPKLYWQRLERYFENLNRFLFLRTLFLFQINWVHIINHVLSIVNLTVLPTEQIVVYAPEFLAKLNDILATYQSTESGKKILFNYMLWHIVNDFVGLLSKPFRDAKKEFTESMSGLTGNDDIWHTCITDTDSVLGYALGALFVKETFSGESKAKAKKMIEDVRRAFIANLPKLDWMDPVTMQAAIDKANAVIDMIGYPDYIMDEVKLDKKYESVSSSIFLCLFHSWGMSPPTVNAYYTTNKNTIVFPAGILQAPFFDRSFPQSLNYGAMGVVMGHELTHGFDDQGRQFDKNGNLKPWWDAEAVLRFKNKTQCMVDQYSSYQLNGEKERGKQTLGENIADNGGLKSAFYAYQKWVELNGKEQLLPALGLSHEKLFFLSFAQVVPLSSDEPLLPNNPLSSDDPLSPGDPLSPNDPLVSIASIQVTVPTKKDYAHEQLLTR